MKEGKGQGVFHIFCAGKTNCGICHKILRMEELILKATKLISWQLVMILLILVNCVNAGFSQQSELVEEYRRWAIAETGQVGKGQSIFFDQQGAKCSSCHTIGGQGRSVGPALDSIGDKYNRITLIESILTPSAEIAPGYRSLVVETLTGEIYTGILESTSELSLSLVSADGLIRQIAKSNIKHRREEEISLMPNDLEKIISPPDFVHLIAYLQILREPHHEQSQRHGQPNLIEELDTPIQFIPLHSTAEKFDQPVWFGAHPVHAQIFVVLEHRKARIWLLDQRTVNIQKRLFADLSDQVSDGPWEGLVCMAFHPQFTQNRRYFLKHEIILDNRRFTLVVERLAGQDFMSDSAQPSQELLRIEQPADNHNGGTILFGPDGYLYIGMGDGGPQEDPLGRSQDLSQLLGKILRIDVDRLTEGKPYGIPPDNPWVDDAVPGRMGEIWAIGMREPWRMSFDSLTQDLWVGDVGQVRFEEITIVRAGENHGWNVYEGFELFSRQFRRDTTIYIPPVFAYERKYGVSVTGGHVYRADPKSDFYGQYICGDFESKRIWSLEQRDRRLHRIRQIGVAPSRISSFGTDLAREIYLVGYDDGMIYHLDLSNTAHLGVDMR